MTYQGIEYRCAESAYQAQKAPLEERAQFSSLLGPQAKKAGQRIVLDPVQWNRSREQVMWEILWAKFTSNPLMGAMLLTEPAPRLIEHNTWGDSYWGVDLRTRQGENRLGKLLMVLRNHLRDNCPDKVREREPGAIDFGPGSSWENTYGNDSNGLNRYCQHVVADPERVAELSSMKSQSLYCPCAERVCHVDILRTLIATWTQ